MSQTGSSQSWIHHVHLTVTTLAWLFGLELQLQSIFYTATSVSFAPSLECARARGMSSMSSCLFVSLFVRHFLACSHVQDTFKSSLYTQQVDQVKKVACRWSTIDGYGLEASLF